MQSTPRGSHLEFKKQDAIRAACFGAQLLRTLTNAAP